MSITKMKQSEFDVRYNYCKRHRSKLIRVNATERVKLNVGEEGYSPGYFCSWMKHEKQELNCVFACTKLLSHMLYGQVSHPLFSNIYVYTTYIIP